MWNEVDAADIARGLCSLYSRKLITCHRLTGGTERHWDYDSSLSTINRASFSLEPVIRANKGMVFDLVELSLASCLRI